jgi:hypothetical protein
MANFPVFFEYDQDFCGIVRNSGNGWGMLFTITEDQTTLTARNPREKSQVGELGL